MVEASRRRRASPGKPESQRGKKKERGNPHRGEERDDSQLKWEMRKNEGAADGLAGTSRKGSAGQIKEKERDKEGGRDVESEHLERLPERNLISVSRRN